jgi:hypothetical protein
MNPFTRNYIFITHGTYTIMNIGLIIVVTARSLGVCATLDSTPPLKYAGYAQTID